MSIYYIGYYDAFNNISDKRSVSPAGSNKMSYIASALVGIENVEIVSPAVTTDDKSHKGKKINLSPNLKLKLFYTFGRRYKIGRFLSSVYRRFSLFSYIFFNIKSVDTVVVYHSLAYMKTIQALRKIKKCKVIIEVEEIYGDVICSPAIVQKEMRYLSCADAYIFPTVLLDEKINIEHKPSCIVHGTYQAEADRGIKFDDGKIHVVYAGTFDPRKGGAAAAAAAAEFLDERYHVHIIGFGSEMEKKELLDTIEHISIKTECKLTYDGLKSGEDYIRFIQSCDIGLSTQNPEADFNDTSFPSKILSYMANGLRVVSIRIPAIETSAVGGYIYYYDEQTPQKIANTIIAVDMNTVYDSRTIIKKLNDKFTNEIKRLMNI